MSRREHVRFETPIAAPPPLNLSAHALFLDLDGTLIELAERHDRVSASTELLALLHVLARRMDGAIALITGRTIADADRILAGAMQAVAGGHGFEMRILHTKPITRESVDLSPVAAAAADACAMADAGLLPALIEDKLSSVALHYRHAPEFEPIVRAAAAELAHRHGLRTLEGKMVFELAAGARTKADAVASLMLSPPFAGRKPVALGDDVTDENAFRQTRSLGGFAILVGQARPSLAQYLLAGPADVFAWMSAVVLPEGAR